MKELTRETFNNAVISNETPLMIVDFWAPWCGPCKTMGALLDKIENNYPDVTFCKVNCDDEEELSEEMAIRNLPTLFIYKNGGIVEKVSGMKSEAELDTLIKKYL